jgi:hypothetical protein
MSEEAGAAILILAEVERIYRRERSESDRPASLKPRKSPPTA